MRNKFLIVSVLLTACTLRLSAQNGYTNLQFVENKGQWDKSISFRAEFPTGIFYLQKQGFGVLMHNADELKAMEEKRHGHVQPAQPAPSGNTVAKGASSNIIHSHFYQVDFVNANQEPQIVADKALPTYNNYYIGHDPSKWASGCKIYQGLTYKNIYPNVDLRYFTDGGTLKYDLIVHPGADPSKIAMKYTGADKLSIRSRQLIIKTSVGEAKESEPLSYQLTKTGRTEVEAKFVVSADNTVRFNIKNYSPDEELIIDPTLVFCTFTGSHSDNWGYTATYDGAGNFYSGSIILDESYGGLPNGNGFLFTPGAFQTHFQGGDDSEGGGYPVGWEYDVGIMKFNSTGSAVMFATYLGGAGDEQPHSLIVDNNGDLIVAGRTSSGSTFPGTLYGPGGGFDIFIAKFNPFGTNLIGCMRIGGIGDDGVNIAPKYSNSVAAGTNSLRLNYGDDGRSEVNIDPSGNIYLASCTRSITSANPADNYPTTPGAFQTSPGGGNQDGVVIKLNPGLTSVLFSSYLGGSADDAAFVLALNPLNGQIYVGGGTASTNFPGTKNVPVLFPANQGGIDGFVSIISNDGSTLIESSYFGTTGTEVIYGVKFDNLGAPYIMGTTTGNWPVLNAKFHQTGGKQFIAKLLPNLSNWVYSTVFGTNSTFPNLSPTAFLVDKCQNVYVAGWGGGIDVTDHYNSSGTSNMTVSKGAIQTTTDDADFYFIVIKKNADSLLYATFYGQYGGFSDHVDGGTSRFDQQGIIYEAMCANCYGPPPPFPTTLGVVHPYNGTNGLGCNLAAVKIAFNFAGVSAGVKSTINGIPDTSGCVTLDVLLSDTVRNAKSYIWNFGDGTPPLATTSYQEPHNYSSIGNYLVMLIAIDSSSCNVSDTAYITIHARNDPALLSLDIAKLPPCTSLSYQFSNLSTAPGGKPFTNSSFVWNFGDGSPLDTAGISPPSIDHSYVSSGTYIVRLQMIDTNYCNYPGEIDDTLSVAPLVKAQFLTPAMGCVPYTAYFNNTSLAGQQFIWNFGDGSPTSAAISPSHFYGSTGSYTVTLIAIDSNTCNITDTSSTTITVDPIPTAAFTYGPEPPQANKPTIFYNSSTGAIHYKWLFGDGVVDTTSNSDTVMHQYERTGTFNACLVAFNQFECPDTACAPVTTIVNPLLAVPNAFTPGRFGENSIIRVQGFGISAITFRIYNRWGQLVFQTNDPNQGWDGTFRGTPQPMDVYAYTVEAQFFDGSKTSQKGDITLIR